MRASNLKLKNTDCEVSYEKHQIKAQIGDGYRNGAQLGGIMDAGDVVGLIFVQLGHGSWSCA